MQECVKDTCERPVISRGMCNIHYRAEVRAEKLASGRLCAVQDCQRPQHSGPHCLMHYKRVRNNGTTDLIVRNLGHSSNLPGYIRGRHEGYVRLVKYDDMGAVVHRVMEHRVVMEQHIERELLDSENVHHVNGDRSDNRIENLELWSTSQPSGQRIEDKVEWARELLRLYSPHDLASLTIISA